VSEKPDVSINVFSCRGIEIEKDLDNCFLKGLREEFIWNLAMLKHLGMNLRDILASISCPLVATDADLELMSL
jgi:hypothetical protein